MTYRMLIPVLAAAALIALPAVNALADESKDNHVVIVKCSENNVTPTAPVVLVAQASTGFTLPASCAAPFGGSCADCLRDLIIDPFDCEGDDEFTSNVVVEQQSTPPLQPISINKFVFACGP